MAPASARAAATPSRMPPARSGPRSARSGPRSARRPTRRGTWPTRSSRRARRCRASASRSPCSSATSSGSTALAERLGPEAMHGLLESLLRAGTGGGAPLRGHGQPVPRRRLHGAVRGADRPRGPRAPRRPRRARRRARRARSDRARLESGEQRDAQLRMGLNTGLVVVGAIGDNLRMDYTAVGDTTHLAARLQQARRARRDPASARPPRGSCAGYVALERRGHARVRGRAAPVTSYRVIGAGAGASRLESGRAAAQPLRRARARGSRCCASCSREVRGGARPAWRRRGRARHGQVAAPPGVPPPPSPRRATCLEGRCLSYGSAIPYLPVLDLVRARAGSSTRDPPERRADKVRATLDDVGHGRRPSGRPTCCTCSARGGHGALGGARARRRSRRAPSRRCARSALSESRRAAARARRRGPALDRRDLGGVPGLAGREPRRRAASARRRRYRPGYRPPWMDRSYATQLSLAPLRRDESLRVVRSVLPGRRRRDPLAALILDKAEGNPFFLEELARAVGDASARAARGARTPSRACSPARIDRLPEAAKRVLQTASVLGREFPLRLLEAIWDAPGSLDAALARARAARVPLRAARRPTSPTTSSSTR